MSIKKLPRELGIILRCNGTNKTCSLQLQTAQVQAKGIRTYAKSISWGRGLRKGHKRKDLCPDCLQLEKELHAKQQAEWEAEKARRDEMRKAKLKPKASKTFAEAAPKARNRKPLSEATPSPSAASAPAPAT